MKFYIRLAALTTLATPALIALSCSHLTNSDRKDASASQQNLLLSYQKAKELEKSDPTSSCSLYTRISKENFPLKNLSLIKSHLVCTETGSLDKVPEQLIDQEPWLANMELDRQIFEAQRDQNFRALTVAQLKKAQKLVPIREKVQWLQAALETSKKIQPLNAEEQTLQVDIQARLYKLAPRFLPDPTARDYFNVGMDWIYQRQFAKGRDFLEKVVSNPSSTNEEQYQARRALRNSFKTEQNKEQHVIEAGKFAHWTEKHSTPARIHEAFVTWARAQWTEGSVTAARSTLDEAEKILRKKKYPLDEINFIRGRTFEEARNNEQALQWFAKAEKDSRRGSAVRDRILFNQAWILRKQGKFQAAADSFQKLKAETLDTYDKNRFSFWLARSLKQAQKSSEAEKELQELSQNDPLGYYGLLAYRELNQEIPALKVEQRKLAADDTRPSAVPSQDYDLISALIFVDEPDVLGKFLDSKTLDLRNQQSQNQDAWLYYLKSYARAGLFNPLFQQIGNLTPELKAQLLAQNPELLFPRKFLDLIQAWADKFSVRPELMLSIIRQESAFNPQARSGADAVGLMQILPSVAKLHEKKTGLQFEHFEDLYKPELNIPFGASILADLGKKYRGQFILTAAAYNANEKAIGTWLKTRLQDDPLEFIEDIPYEETRAYVKLVLRNFIFYSRLSNPGQKLAFPNWCLEDLQSFKVSTR